MTTSPTRIKQKCPNQKTKQVKAKTNQEQPLKKGKARKQTHEKQKRGKARPTLMKTTREEQESQGKQRKQLKKLKSPLGGNES